MPKLHRKLVCIEAVVLKVQKPFFFAEAGCMSVAGSPAVSNDWTVKGAADLKGQADWYRAIFEACAGRDWVSGFALWSWPHDLYDASQAAFQGDYELYAKSAERIVGEYYSVKG